MKKLLLLLLLILIGCSTKVEQSRLVERDGLFHLPYNKKPYTGYVEDDCFKGYIKEGKFHGHFQYYHRNEYYDSTINRYTPKCWSGSLYEEGDYKNGERDGVWVEWSDDGNLVSEVIFKDGEYFGEKE